MENFSTILLHRVVPLKSASDIVRFSFIAEKSVSHLDLELCQELMVSNYTGTSSHRRVLESSNHFINTEEKCRKYFTPSRSILYNLHLDLPKGREYNLHQCPRPVKGRYLRDARHICEIIPICGFYNKIVSSFVAEIIEVNSKKLNILRWLLKVTVSGKSLLYYLEIETSKKFIDIFYPSITVPELFKNYTKNLAIIEWITTYEDPEILEYLLYYARLYGNIDLMEEDCSDIIDICILQHRFKNISPILKYINAPNVPSCEYLHYPTEILLVRPGLDRAEFRKAQKQTGKGRMHLIMQLIWIYFRRNQHHSDGDILEALRLIWSSVPDPYLSFKEIMGMFREVFSAEELERIYNFYVTAIGVFYEMIQPRSLQHLCRTVIRRTLRENQCWIPKGVAQTGLSNRLQLFLNLNDKRDLVAF